LEFLAGPELEKVIGKRLTKETMKKAIDFGLEMQKKLAEMETEEKLGVMEELGRRWSSSLDAGELDELVGKLSSKTGYCEKIVLMDLEFVSTLLDPEVISLSLEHSLPEGLESLDAFVEVRKGELYRCIPAGPVFVIGSGNSVLPVMISGIFSLMTNNFTIIRPSSSNKEAVFQIFSILRRIGEEETPIGMIAREISNSSLVFYEEPEGKVLEFLLKESEVGVVNFWGADPALSEVVRSVSSNPNHPRLSLLGPLTGYAIVHRGADLEEAARSLAEAMVYYDQQLCSSPTEACFIGDFKQAKEFAEKVGRELEALTSEFPIRKSEYEIYLTQSTRNILRMRGSYLVVPKDRGPEWTIAVTEGKSNLDAAFARLPDFTLPARRRFIELIVVSSEPEAVERVKMQKEREPFKGIMGIQTVGLAAPRAAFDSIASSLAECGVYRVVPLKDMHLRSPIEPFDGRHLVRDFVNILYVRRE